MAELSPILPQTDARRRESAPRGDSFGLALRKLDHPEFLGNAVDVDFIEALTECFLVDGGWPIELLRRLKQSYPIVLTGMAMSLGSPSGVDSSYLARLKRLTDFCEPFLICDHLGWSHGGGQHFPMPLPLPYTEQSLDVVCRNIDQVQQVLGQPIAIKNIARYFRFSEPEMPEWEFIAAMCERSGCGLALDLAALHVNSRNHGADAREWISGLPADRVRLLHLSGHHKANGLLVHSTADAVPDAIWLLYAHAREVLGPVATVLECQSADSPLGELVSQLATARAVTAKGITTWT